MNMKKGIEALQKSYLSLLDANAAYQDYMKHCRTADRDGVLRHIKDAAQSVTQLCQRITDQREEQNQRIYGAGLLRVKLYGGSHVREVTIQKPDNMSEKPYISETAYNALKFQFGTSIIFSGEKYTIDVLNPSWRKVATIKPMV